MKNPNELSAASSLRGDELQLIEQKASIVVGIANSRTRLRWYYTGNGMGE